MKPLLNIVKEFPEITNCGRRRCCEEIADFLHFYASNHKIFGTSESANRHYINNCFLIADFLYEYYELDKYYFELLDYAASKLIVLIEDQIKKLSTDESKTEEMVALKTALANSLDKVTMIFQTAADKTEQPLYQEIWTIKAHEYSGKADKIQGRLTVVYEYKMRDLYAAAARSCKIDFIAEQFQKRAAEYQRKINTMESLSHKPAFFIAEKLKIEETRPLLRHRHSLTPASDSQ